MGCDGGTIPRRDELVRVKKKPEAKDKDSELIFLWCYCFITQQLLQSPIVTCGLGKLYNKIALIEALLNKETLPEGARHIKSLKDIKELNLTPNPAYNENEDKKGGAVNGLSAAPYICPVIGLEMSGKFRFVALWSCGCVFSERALKEIDTKTCHKCGKPFTNEDVVVLNGNEEDLVLMKERMQLRQLKQKKNKEKKNKGIKQEPASNSEPIPSTSTTTPGTSSTTSSNTNNNKNTSEDKTKMNGTKRLGSLHKKPEIELKKMKADYSVAKDPQVSDVYKSIFTSHKSEKEQNRAHWITYNPFYN